MQNELIVSDKTAVSLYAKMMHKLLQSLKYGHILLINTNGESFEYGDNNATLKATIYVNNQQFYKKSCLGGDIGFAESFMLGQWETNSLTNVLRILAQNITLVDQIDNKFITFIYTLFSRISSTFRKNSEIGAKINISEHYDLGNDFFCLFLDPTLMYSCAQFTKTDNLNEASIHKLDTICRKLHLSPTDHLLEIGTGWGGLAVHAATNYGCKVTTTTISQEQYNYTKKIIQKHSLGDKITLLLQDYRKLEGKYDKLVSIEMIEAVGVKYFSRYFQQCSRLLKNNGLFLLQSITISEQRYHQYLRGIDFIKKYIFPGGCLPSVSSIMNNITEDTDLTILGLEDISLNYAKTLRAWRNNFIENINKIRGLGFNDTFINKWIYYFSYCEAGFLERNTSTYQFLFGKSNYRSSTYYDY